MLCWQYSGNLGKICNRIFYVVNKTTIREQCLIVHYKISLVNYQLRVLNSNAGAFCMSSTIYYTSVTLVFSAGVSNTYFNDCDDFGKQLARSLHQNSQPATQTFSLPHQIPWSCYNLSTSCLSSSCVSSSTS